MAPSAATHSPLHRDADRVRYAKLRLRCNCPECGAVVPVPSPTREPACPGCGSQLQLALDFWTAFLAAVEDDFPSLPRNLGRIDRGNFAGVEVDYLYGRKTPRCGACQTPVPMDSIPTGEHADLRCSQCGSSHRCEPAPTWLGEACRTAAQLLHATRGPAREAGDGAFYLRFEGLSDKQLELDRQAHSARRGQRQPDRLRCPVCAAPELDAQYGCARCGYRPKRGLHRRAGFWVTLLSVAVLGAVSYGGYALYSRMQRYNTAIARSFTQTRLHWKARVEMVEGLPIKEGSDCQVDARLRSDAQGVHRFEVQVNCEGQTVYRSHDPITNRLTGIRCRLKEGPALSGPELEYELRCRDDGRSFGGTRLRLNTLKGQATLFSEGPDFRLNLQLLGGGRRSGEALYASTRNAQSARGQPIKLGGQVVQTTGAAQVQPGDACLLTLVPIAEAQAGCRVQLECGGKPLYGGPFRGFVKCQVEGGRVLWARDDEATKVDGDPELHMDPKQGLCTVLDQDPAWGASVRLTTP